MSRLRTQRCGFTLVELMIIVAIVAILATLAVAAYRGYQTAARDQEAIAGLHQLAAQATNVIN
ncbi:MAG: prepilin-type N-terminal cleavage/methylation domain-containing protein, partial [Proteobacteria bacterium]|nr:prepilin-type N-terminal cleavage/methylation domain-containing protein [Pseudomonadota bacterium]